MIALNFERDLRQIALDPDLWGVTLCQEVQNVVKKHLSISELPNSDILNPQKSIVHPIFLFSVQCWTVKIEADPQKVKKTLR